MRQRLIRGSFIVLIVMVAAVVGRGAEPISFWPFNGDLTDAIGTRDGTFNGGVPGYVSGKNGKGLAFDGSDDSVSVPYANPAAYTISAWVKPERVEAMSIIAHTAGDPTSTWSHQIRMAVGGVFEHYLYDGAAKSVMGTTPIQADTWYHVAITAEHNGTMHLFVNGQEEGDAVTVGTLWGGGSVFLMGSNSGNAMGWFQGVIDDVRFYDVIVPQAEIMPTMTAAASPNPEDAAEDVLRDAVLSWTPGEFAASHNLYLGTSFDEVDNGTVPTAAGLDVNAFDPDRFEFGTTYFWRVDEVNGTPDKTVFKGDVWRFTAEPYAIMIPVDVNHVTASSAAAVNPPGLAVNGSGLTGNAHSTNSDAMWLSAPTDLSPWLMVEFDRIEMLDHMRIWNSNSTSEGFIGWGLKDVNIETSMDGVDWTTLSESSQIAKAPGLPTYDEPQAIDLGLVQARYVRLDILSNWGGLLQQYGVSEIQFYGLPVCARTPVPASGAADIVPNSVVTWRAGRQADQHTVYLGQDPNAVTDGLAPSVTSNTNSLDLTEMNLQLGETYYWRVDEVNAAETPSVWAGPVWNISTVAALTVDDFESYSNLSPNRPFQAWLDGFGYSADEFFPVAYAGNGTGAGVGHDIWSPGSPYFDGDIMETGMTLPGSGQSLPFYYSNTGGVASEIERKFLVPQNWAGNGIKTLALYVFGASENSGQLYLKINDTKIAVTSDVVDIRKAGWQLWPVDLSAVNEDLEHVTSLTIGVEGTSASGLLFIDDIGLYPDPIEYVTPTEADRANLLAHYTLDGNVLDSSGHDRHGTENGGPVYGDGVDGQAIQLDGVDDYVEVPDSPGLDVTDTMTIAAWVYREVDSGAWERIVARSDAAEYDYWLQIASNDSLGGGFVDTEGIARNPVDLTQGMPIPVNQWTHLAFVYDGKYARAYVNGLLDKLEDVGSFTIRTSARPLWFGRLLNSYGFSGLVDEVRLYNSALSAAEIAWLNGRTEPMVKPFWP